MCLTNIKDNLRKYSPGSQLTAPLHWGTLSGSHVKIVSEEFDNSNALPHDRSQVSPEKLKTSAPFPRFSLQSPEAPRSPNYCWAHVVKSRQPALLPMHHISKRASQQVINIGKQYKWSTQSMSITCAFLLRCIHFNSKLLRNFSSFVMFVFKVVPKTTHYGGVGRKSLCDHDHLSTELQEEFMYTWVPKSTETWLVVRLKILHPTVSVFHMTTCLKAPSFL